MRRKRGRERERVGGNDKKRIMVEEASVKNVTLMN